MKKILLILLSLFSISGTSFAQWELGVMHSFNGTNGATSIGTMTLVGNTLYGRTSAGGVNGKGVIFKINTDSTDFQILYNFTDGSSNTLGKEPHHDAMLVAGNSLYGTALMGGNNDNGVVYRIDLNGQNYTALHVFAGGNNDGAQPHSCLMMVDSVLYGLTAAGGTHGNGTLYKMNLDGSGFSVLHSFHNSTGDNSHGRLTLSSGGNKLFGMTKEGGSSDFGVIFSYDLNSTDYAILHTFIGGANDGKTTDHGYLARSGDTVFGMTQYGGASDEGIVFSMNDDGTNFQIIHSFGSSANDGLYPYGSLELSNGWLYGTTREGGDNNDGTVFRISTTGDDYEILHSLNTPVSGEFPIDNVVLEPEGNRLYFFSQRGGVYDTTGTNSYGTINTLFTLGSIGIQTISTEMPEKFHLFQNYPNPFNPATKIRYSIKNSANVSLVIYDLNGKELAKIVNKYQQPGTYSVDFNGSEYSSGLYFARLVSGENAETRRMILLK